MNLAMLLEMVAEGAPDRILIGSPSDGLTSAALWSRARGAAAAFRAMGTEHVGMVDLNSEAVPLALFGSALAGLPFAPVNYRATDEQLESILRRLTPGVVIVGEGVQERIGDDPGLRVISRDDFLDLTTKHADESENLPVDPDGIAVLLFTSGTTGAPKAAVLRHRHLTSYIIATVDFLGAAPEEAQLVSVPPYHVAGISAILSSVYAGRRISYLPGFDADAWVNTVRAQRVTQAMVVPTMLSRILTRVTSDGEGLPSLRHLSYGGGRMPLSLIEQTMETLPNADFVNAYGLTETSSTIAILTPEDHREAFSSASEQVRRRLGSVGRPLPGVEVEVRDSEGKPLGVEENGEIFVRGEQVSGEYLGRSALTDDGWFPTRDAGFMDEEGFLYLGGRLDDVIVRGAENLSPGEIEDALMDHPSVLEAAVVGIPDATWGETVAAAVVLQADATASVDELKDWVRSRLRSTKTPEVIDVREALPYNETGKLLRRVIRDELSGGR